MFRIRSNRIITGWDMEIMLFSKWPSAILNLRKLQCWSRDIYRHVILHLCSKFRVDRPICRADIAKKRYSIWRPSAILDLLWRHYIASENCILRSQLCLRFERRSVSCLVLTFWWKITKNVKIKYSNPQKAHPCRKTRLISVERWRFIRRRDM